MRNRKLHEVKSILDHENVSKIFGISLGTLVRNQDKENFPVPSLEPLTSLNATDPANLQDDTEPDDSTTPLGRKSGVNAINQMAEKEHIAKLKDFLTNDPPETLGKAVFISSSIGNIAAPNTFAVRKVNNLQRKITLIPHKNGKVLWRETKNAKASAFRSDSAQILHFFFSGQQEFSDISFWNFIFPQFFA